MGGMSKRGGGFGGNGREKMKERKRKKKKKVAVEAGADRGKINEIKHRRELSARTWSGFLGFRV